MGFVKLSDHLMSFEKLKGTTDNFQDSYRITISEQSYRLNVLYFPFSVSTQKLITDSSQNREIGFYLPVI